MKDIPLRERVYAVYEGDTNVMDGTLEEICAKRGIKYATARMMASESYRKRLSSRGKYKSHIEFIRIDNLEEDWDNDELAVPAITEDITI